MIKDFATPGMRLFDEKKSKKKTLVIRVSIILAAYYSLFYWAWRSMP